MIDVAAFLSKASREEIAGTIARLAGSSEHSTLGDLREFLLTRDGNTYDKHVIPHLVCRALLSKGPDGVEILSATIKDSPGSIYPVTIVESLWYAARGTHPRTILGWWPLLSPLDEPLSSDTIRASREAFHDFVVESQTDDVFQHLIQFLLRGSWMSSTGTEEAEFRTAVFETFSESTIKLTRRLISEFEELIDQELPEEEYQQFLTRHPVLIDPLANQIIPKQKLGSGYVTDFVLRRLDNDYVLVEIERPQDKIFTQSNDFARRFAHAIGQIVDFQEWIDQHAEYARSLMPGISSPRGLLIMGRGSHLSDRNEAKLKRFCINLHTIDIVTYDDLSHRSRDFYSNIHLNMAQRRDDSRA